MMNNFILHNLNIKPDFQQEQKRNSDNNAEIIMSSSIISTISSSLTSPIDSGVQMLDSEENGELLLTSSVNSDVVLKETVIMDKENVIISEKETNDSNIQKYTESDFVNKNVDAVERILSRSVPNYFDKFSQHQENASKHHFGSCKNLFDDEVFEMDHPIIKSNTEAAAEIDVMNLSLNSYELLDYTMQNIEPSKLVLEDSLHISMSEEVNENLKVILDGKENGEPSIKTPLVENVVATTADSKPPEEQIVFRRERKKKTKSDTPKKRVSFHEDILNSTKIDDIHINLGFITHEQQTPDVSLNFFQRGFIKKPDVVVGRYSWAAEGDAPFYEKSLKNNRQIKSDIYNNSRRKSSSSSSNSTSSASASSSIDEEEDSSAGSDVKKEPSMTLSEPKSSCLKKTKNNNKKYIKTNIVQEEIPTVTAGLLKKKKSESNLLDTNIFGSLRNILNFSTSAPLTERGVPEGQEDVEIFSQEELMGKRRKSFALFSDTVELAKIEPSPVTDKRSLTKTNLKLTKSEGFYPNYPNQAEIPANIILCDSNVYEHKGISYSYEYNNYQKMFEKQNNKTTTEQQQQQGSSSSMQIYQKILSEFNLFRRRNNKEEFEDYEDSLRLAHDQTEIGALEVEEIEELFEPESKSFTSTPKKLETNLNKYDSSSKLDWLDTETISDISETRSNNNNTNSKHLDSPKKNVHKMNHYSIQRSFIKEDAPEITADNNTTTRSLTNLRTTSCSSKNSLINRFLKNVTLKKMIDLKNNGRNTHKLRNYMDLYPKVKKFAAAKCNEEIDKMIEKEIFISKQIKDKSVVENKFLTIHLNKQLFRNEGEHLLKNFRVRSAYSSTGFSKSLRLTLTNRAIYIFTSASEDSQLIFLLPYTDLNTILIGPNLQTIHFSNYNTTTTDEIQCILTTGCSQITCDIIARIEFIMRSNFTKKTPLPALKILTMRDMMVLRKTICRQTSVDKAEEYFYYSIVNIQDFIVSSFESEEQQQTPTEILRATTKEGPLMVKTCERWETAYFILKAGVLYMFSSSAQKVPLRIFPLINGACQSARRTDLNNTHRPHTFQIIVEGNLLLLAAPNEYVASEWLQELIHAASGLYTVNDNKRSTTQSCSLLMTSEHILTVREVFLPSCNCKDEIFKESLALSCAKITDLVAFKLPASSEQSWCILEFSCREVHEYSGDWIIYFSTNSELESFISTLEMLWQYGNENGDSFPLSTIPDSDFLNKKCMDTYNALINN